MQNPKKNSSEKLLHTEKTGFNTFFSAVAKPYWLIYLFAFCWYDITGYLMDLSQFMLIADAFVSMCISANNNNHSTER